MYPIIIKFIKFLGVGLSGMLIDFGITFLCKEKLLINKYISNFLGSLFMTINNFFLNKYFTFKSYSDEMFSEIYWFIIISLLSLIIYNIIVWISINKWNVNFYISKMIAIFFITFWNFFGHLYITFQI